jgi:NMD protein affecting ribosome stability and mRNA decay
MADRLERGRRVCVRCGKRQPRGKRSLCDRCYRPRRKPKRLKPAERVLLLSRYGVAR